MDQHKTDDHTDRAERQSRQPTRRKLKGWQIRVPVFLLAVWVSVYLGLRFMWSAAPGTESADLLTNPPLRVDAFATSPNVTVSLNMVINTSRSCSGGTVAADCEKGFVGDLYGTIAGPGSTNDMNPDDKVLIISTRPAYPPPPYSLSGFPELPPESAQTTVRVGDRAHTAPSVPDINFFSISIGKIEQTQGDSQFGTPIAEFRLPSGSVTEEANGSFFGHLPAIGFLSSVLTNSHSQSTSTCDTVGTSSNCVAGSSSTFDTTGLEPVPGWLINKVPWILTEEGHLHGSTLNDFILFPNMRENLTNGNVSDANLLKIAQNLSNYPTIPGSQHALYWPTRLLATEILAGARSSLEHARIDSILPATGSLQGDSFVWQGTGSLEPTISATNISAAESQSTSAFYSGIAFATAAAAFIALVQEVPKKIRLSRWIALVREVPKKIRLSQRWPRWRRARRKHNIPRSAQRTDCGLGWPR
jgi:hypothetical protein